MQLQAGTLAQPQMGHGVVAPEPLAKAGEMFGKLKNLLPNNRKYYLNFNDILVNS